VGLASAMREVGGSIVRLVLSAAGPRLDKAYLAADVPGPTRLTAHATFADRVVEAGDKPGFRILEIGSREVAGGPPMRGRLSHAEYVGFDYYPGPNVDVAGDAHQLSDLVEGLFDVVYSTAVFEHLAMPWVVAEEIARVLKPGGLVFVETHFSYSSHERPWHFFQFSDMGLRALFSPALGFECVEAGMDSPMVGRFSAFAAPYLRFQPIPGLYCHSLFVGRKTRDVPGFRWRDADVDEVADATRYPRPPQ
jgi:SAM-dependent methyltransferase